MRRWPAGFATERLSSAVRKHCVEIQRPQRRLWFEFLRDLPQKFTRQKPLSCYVADYYYWSERLVIELDGDSHFNDAAERYDQRRTRHFSTPAGVIRFTTSRSLRASRVYVRRSVLRSSETLKPAPARLRLATL